MKFFDDAEQYGQDIQYLEPSTSFPRTASIELIIFGGKDYFQVEYDKFIKAFEWSWGTKQWEPKKH